MKIELHIDRLVLDGVNGDPDVIRKALHTELTRLIAAAPTSTWQPSRTPRLRGPEMSVGQASSTGRDIARSVYQAVSHGQ
ncbi:hypothetical protein ABZ468_37420 [Streptomyces sp. NPDC005708]|uniref:hypothetical protein n=1 Tax=unclassified Streptomyces TaxID=2593676 RepID=UPI00340ADB4B